MGSSDEILHRISALGLCLDDVVVTGASIGLPRAENGVETSAFCTPDDFDRIFAGVSGISRLSDEEIDLMVEKNVVQMRRNADGIRQQYRISSPEEVIRIAGKVGDFDLAAQHGVPEFILPALDSTFKMAIAAGLEALRTAGIPLDRKHTSGKLLLPEELQNSTGVIFAASFPVLDSMIEEVSRHLTYKLGKQSLQEKIALVRSISKHVTDRFPESTEVFKGLVEEAERDTVLDYEFNRKLLFQILVMANSQLAELIGARGPNMNMNAACASSAMAISIAEDWIRVGKASRVLVVGADNVTSRNLLQYVGTGFLALGAASTKGTPEEAALPFSSKRNGLILGAGAVGMVLESESEANRRKAVIMSRILAINVVNSAYHGSAIDGEHVVQQLNTLLDRVERVHGISREEIARKGLYISHETFTCVNGGCAAVEIGALQSGFGKDLASELLMANTKAYTGHSMGAGIEDAVAVMSLFRGEAPPIPAVVDKPDEKLGRLHLARGGRHDCSYALRFAAGFGSQCVYILYGKD